MELACEELLQGTRSIRQAAAQFKVPYSSLQRRIMKNRGTVITVITKKSVVLSFTEKMKAAGAAVHDKSRSIRKASVDFNVSYSALQRHVSYPALKPAGGQLKFSTKEENDIAELLL
jgi:helix-turn-helix, Psq domain